MRLKKSPKLYFYDSGLLCYLLGITSPGEVAIHSMRGAIFESFVLSELSKHGFHHHKPVSLFFWQDKLGREVDCLMERGKKLIPVEIKSSQTLTPDSFKNLAYWLRLSGTNPRGASLVYAGRERQIRKQARVLGWLEIDRLLSGW